MDVAALVVLLLACVFSSPAFGKGMERSGTTPQRGCISERGRVEVADNYTDDAAASVARFAGFIPRQDWREVKRTEGTLSWYKFYLTQDESEFFWPKDQWLMLVCKDSTYVTAERVFVVSPDGARTPTFLGRSTVVGDASAWFHHDPKTMVVYAGFPSATNVNIAGRSRAWNMDDVVRVVVGKTPVAVKNASGAGSTTH
jgi:hypothetical protein